MSARKGRKTAPSSAWCPLDHILLLLGRLGNTNMYGGGGEWGQIWYGIIAACAKATIAVVDVSHEPPKHTHTHTHKQQLKQTS